MKKTTDYADDTDKEKTMRDFLVAYSRPILNAYSREYLPGNYLVAWESLFSPFYPTHSVGMRIDAQGYTFDAAPFSIRTNGVLEALIAGKSGQFLALSSTQLMGNNRVIGTFISVFEPIIIVDGKPHIFWFSEAGKRYRVQYTSFLSPPAWNNLGNEIVATGEIATFVDDTVNGSAQRFYRVIELP